MLKLKPEYKTAVIGGIDGKHRIEMLFCEEGLYPVIAKSFPEFFYDDSNIDWADGVWTTTPDDDLRTENEIDFPKKKK